MKKKIILELVVMLVLLITVCSKEIKTKEEEQTDFSSQSIANSGL